MHLLLSTSPSYQQSLKKLVENPKLASNKKAFCCEYLLQLVKKELSHIPQSISPEKAQKYPSL